MKTLFNFMVLGIGYFSLLYVICRFLDINDECDPERSRDVCGEQKPELKNIQQ